MHQSPRSGAPAPARPNREMIVLIGGLIAMAHATNMMVVPSLPRFVDSVLGAAFVVVGFALGTTSIGRFLTNLPAGMLADRIGRRYLLLAGVLGVGTFASLSGTATEVPVFLLLRFLTGVCSAMTITLGNVVITDISTVENRGRVLGLMHGIQLVAGLASPALGGILAEFVDIRAPFLASGLGAIAFGVWALLRLPETRPRGRTLREAHREGEPQATTPSRKELLRNGAFLLVCLLGYATFFLRTGGTLALMPLFAEEVVNISPGYMGLLFSVSSALHSALVYPSGWVADKYGRKTVILPAGVLTAIGFAAMPFADTFLSFVVVFILLHAAVGFGGQAPVAYLGDVAPTRARGMAFGIYRTSGDFAGVVAPVTTTALAGAVSFHAAFFVNAILWTVVLTLFIRFAKETAGTRRAGSGGRGH